MEKYIVTAILVTLFFTCIYAVGEKALSTAKRYIVYMGEHSYPDSDSVISSNHDLLASVTGSILQAKEATTHHYHKSFRGFSAILTPEQAEKLRDTKSVISVFESKSYQLHTTHSWEFLGIDAIPPKDEQMKMDPNSDVIIGVIDTGVWPESQSFNDNGLGTRPERFKGECDSGDDLPQFTCNKKIIGARFYIKGYDAAVLRNPELVDPLTVLYRSPRDSSGHGTHTASTIAGSEVNLTLFDASIKWNCEGWRPPEYFFSDVNSIGAFHAFKNNILVSASAGNYAIPGSVMNIAPWILTVAASTVDREFTSNVSLGNSTILKGIGINQLQLDKYYGIIFGADAVAAGVSTENARFCYNNTLDHNLIKGKIVVCTAKASNFTSDDDNLKSRAVKEGGGVGMILIDPYHGYNPTEHVIPTTVLEQKQAENLREYLLIEVSANPTARILQTTIETGKTIHAPKMASFSSMGPSSITPEIIKPDITAPGVNILDAWSPDGDTTSGVSLTYYSLSGTSMACPHASAVASIIKSHRPSWSPSTIKSAMMTTATVMDKSTKPMLIMKNPYGSSTTPLNYGSGHINPSAALDPGLIYDYNTSDIINFLCSRPGLFPSLVECPNPPIPTYNLNYPSIGVSELNGHVSVRRTVTYCGQGPTVFRGNFKAPVGVTVTVEPKKLEFIKAGE
ncbi:hypothetical protein C5167_000460 [Papaver somniferum]|uniref:Inhibitor I9 domain-containing protein n=1 Tax=Papaver somniferum TaxID=3469 RepID=A0A4Y7KVS7_PAPSO|nr:hypothetical protein C5167_000460 [Papaver somniferum]